MSDQVTARDLGLNVASGDEKELFKWFIASFIALYYVAYTLVYSNDMIIFI